MTNPNYTHIALVLDRSGSMGAIKDETIGGVNLFFSKQRELVKSGTKITVTLNQFDTEFDSIYDFVDISKVEDRNSKNYEPRALTALYDAIAKTIIQVGKKLSELPETDRPGSVLVAIVTDGEENSSSDYKDFKKIAEMIKHQTDVYNWEFVFIGSDLKGMEQARELSVSNRLNYKATKEGTSDAFAKVARYASAYTMSTRDGSYEKGTFFKGDEDEDK
jgi:hypothetical protein